MHKKGHAKHKGGVAKEYNLRNKPLTITSQIHENTYTLTSAADTDALVSMRKASNKSWADMCDEDDNPPKHGVSRVVK